MSALGSEVDAMRWTDEQLEAIERREGELLLDAGAGSGKTSVLVERFVRAVLEDGAQVGSILAITFTEKAAAELRDRIRARLRELGADAAARETEAAYISTIHGFCARLLRAHALAAGLDPAFSVLDQAESERVADAAFDEALERLAADCAAEAVELIASYTAGVLREAVLGVHAELRSRGQTRPRLPALPPRPDVGLARAALREAAERVRAELGAIADPSIRVQQALERLSRCGALLEGGEPWPAELERLALPGGNGAALSTPACAAYGEALAAYRTACEYGHVERVHRLLGRLLGAFDDCYARGRRERSGLDFEDLELLARDLLARDAELRDRYRERFAHVMVDELQDTNQVQLELVELIARGNLFCVGDAQQSIYAFRHADVELFERLGERLERAGARTRLQTNFRSRPEILEAVNRAFGELFGERFMALAAGRDDPPAAEALVELLVVDKGSEWAPDGLAAPWRIAEARALAARMSELIGEGAAPRDFVVLTRATTDLRAYERALEERGVPTYVIGGRGYWEHPQVLDAVAYLRALANPLDEEALYTVLVSPLLGVSIDAVVVLAAAARSRGLDPWRVLREPPEGALDELPPLERERLTAFAGWLASERRAASRLAVDELIDRALERSGYDLTMLAMPGGRRRLANVRKLTRLAREHEAASGRDLRGFLDLVRGRAGGIRGFGDPRESEAPVEGEALDAVRLMTIHRAKGLEFPIVCVADLGRMPWRRPELLRIGRAGRIGLRLAAPGTARAQPALDYKLLGEERLAAEQREERRLFYVALTRARERLLVSGAAKLASWEGERTPMGWLGPALVRAGVTPRFIRPEDLEGGAVRADGGGDAPAGSPAAGAEPGPEAWGAPPPGAAVGPAVSRLSYSALAEYERCGYRFYLERVLGLPPQPSVAPGAGATTSAGAGAHSGEVARASPMLSAAERGVTLHALLERLDFRRPAAPGADDVAAAAGRRLPAAEAEEIAALVGRFAAGPLCARLARAADVRREERFAFLLGGELLVTGALDVLAREAAGGWLVVDYKSDRLAGEPPASIVERRYEAQRLVYALAALRAGAPAVEVCHVFLERPEEAVSARFERADADRLQARVQALAAGIEQRRFAVSEQPHRALCDGCPGEDGLCSWPPAATRREAPDRLF